MIQDVVMLFTLAMILGMAPAIACAAGFSPTGSMVTPRTLYTATMLQNGKVLVAGGNDGANSLNSAELYDPAKGTFAATVSMITARQHHTATLLANGKVLLAGGDNTSAGTVGSAELYDPQTGTFSQTGSMGAARSNHTATRLQDGKVLIAGGSDGSNSLDSAELYDPVKGTFAHAGIMVSARHNHTATFLKNGKVLLAGGLYVSTYFDYFRTSSWSVELYDPVHGTFTQTGNMLSQRQGHTATLLDNGNVLITGGSIEFSGMCMGCGPISTAEFYDPASGTFTSTGSMNVERVDQAATLLSNGKVLITGGWAPFMFCYGSEYAELYDPTTGTFAVNAPLPTGAGVPATKLLDDRVLVGGASGVLLYSFMEPARLTVNVTGGWTNVTSSPADIKQSCFIDNPLSLFYPPGSVVTLTAPSMNSVNDWFIGWYGCDSVTGTQCIVTLNADRAVTVDYGPPVDVTISTTPAGLAVDVDGTGYQTPATFWWAQGSMHAIGAPSPQPFSDGNYYFSSWTDGGGQWHMVPASSLTLTASFVTGLMPARIGTTYYMDIFEAYANTAGGAVIESQAATNVGNLILTQGTDISVVGGYDAVYSNERTGMTTVQGTVIVGTGSLVVDRLTIR
jgi:hypothetical protein